MFIKEMENAEKYKSMTIRRWFCCGYGITDKIIDPRNTNSFIEDVMDPYGRQDKFLDELRKQSQAEERRKEATKKELLKYFKDNKKVVDCLYDKLEKGEIYKDIKYCSDCTEENVLSLKKMDNNIGGVIKLKGVNDDDNNIKIQIDDTHDEKRSKRSDSSNSLMDFDVECHISGTEI
jgi:hypothetical protein